MAVAQTYSSMRLEIQKIDYLPPMPAVAQEILIASNDKTSDMDDIAAIIKKDAGLSAKIIGVANSAYFSFPRNVTSLEQAIINILGLDLVKGFALTLAMSGVFKTDKCTNFDIKRYWQSAFFTAELASGFGQYIKLDNDIKSEQLYLFGLLHNIGILVLTDRFPNIMSELFLTAAKDKEKRLIDYESETVDFNHHEAGGWLAQKWHLPDEVIDVIEQHHNLNYQGRNSQLVILLGLCARIARQWQLDTSYCPFEEIHYFEMLGVEEEIVKKYLDKAKAKKDDIVQLVDDITN